MAKEKVEKKEPVAVDEWAGFEMMNQGKYDRAVASVGTEDKRALLTEYDRLGGFIRHNGSKVITGSFWDSKKGTPVENPQPKVLRRQAAVVEETIEVVDVAVEDKPKRAKKTEDAE